MPHQDRFELRRLNSAYVATVGVLPCRPEPRHLWDDVASPDRRNHPAFMAVVAGKLAIRAAVRRGEMAGVEETARRVAHYFDECKWAAQAEYLSIAGREVPLDVAIARASKETTEALYAIQLSSLGQQSDYELTDKEINEAILALVNLRNSRQAAVRGNTAISNRPALALS